MSLSLAFGIVAVVNLAIGYALAIYLETYHDAPASRDRDTSSDLEIGAIAAQRAEVSTNIDLSESPQQSPAVQSAEAVAAADALANAAAETSTQAPADPDAVFDTRTNQTKPLADVGTVAPRTAESTPPSSPAPAEATDENPPAPPVEKTIANADRWLNAAEQLLEEASEEAPPATLVDSAQLEAAITSWWKNDPVRQRPLCVGQIEIDNLRQLTAELGTTVAGKLAKQIERLVLMALGSDDMVAPLGRSRFLVMFPDVSGGKAAMLVDQLRCRLCNTEFVQGERVIRTTLTGGVGEALADESLESFLARAADALADARARGRNCVVWHDGTTGQLVEPRQPAAAPEQISL